MALLTDSYKGRFAATTAPTNPSGHTLRFAYRKNLAGGDTVDLRVQLRSADDATLIREWSLPDIGSAFTLAELTLTPTEAATITNADYTGGLIYVLQREGDATATSDNNRSAEVSWLEFGFTENTVLTPAAATLSLTATAPGLAVTNSVTLTPAASSLLLTAGAPGLTVSAHMTLTPAAAPLTLTAGAPALSISGNVTLAPAAATLTFAPAAPTLTVSRNVTLGATGAVLSLTPAAPTLGVTLSLTFRPPGASLEVQAAAPTLTVTGNITLTPPAATLGLTAAAPILTLSGDFILSPPASSLSVTGAAPTLTVSRNLTLTPLSGTLTLSAAAPALRVANNIDLRSGSAALALASAVPALSLTGFIPAPTFDITGDYVAEHAVAGDYAALIEMEGDGLSQNIPADGEKWYAGDTKVVRITTSRTMTGAQEVRFRIIGADVDKSLGNGVSVEANAIVVAFDPIDTAGKPGSYSYECEAADASGNVGTEAQGRVTLSRNYI